MAGRMPMVIHSLPSHSLVTLTLTRPPPPCLVQNPTVLVLREGTDTSQGQL